MKKRYLRWGPNHPMYQARVMGEFPEQSELSVCSLAWIEAARLLQELFRFAPREKVPRLPQAGRAAKPGLFADTRPKHANLTATKGFIQGGPTPRSLRPCSRERFFREARKPDDGDAGAHRRGGMTPHGGKRSAGRLESFANNAG